MHPFPTSDQKSGGEVNTTTEKSRKKTGSTIWFRTVVDSDMRSGSGPDDLKEEKDAKITRTLQRRQTKQTFSVLLREGF